MKKWIIRGDKGQTGKLAEAILQQRGLNNTQIEHFLSPDYDKDLGDPFLLPDTKIAADRLLEARQKKQTVVIYGDYDIDGITAATVLQKTFQFIGINSSIYIPDRFEEGYGLNQAALEQIQAAGTDLVVTVDCGSTASREVAQAAKAGLPIIITDHHNLTEEMPTQALAHINPKRQDSKYPTTELAGVGVAFTLVRTLIKLAPQLFPEGWEKWLLDLVALGTICDVVQLVGENHLLAKYGLKVLPKTRNLGLLSLMEVAGVEPTDVSSYDLGFRLGPRLNAAGRIEHASLAIGLLNAENRVKAMELADSLNQLNSQRREKTDLIVTQATEQAGKNPKDQLIILASPEWSHGVVGIAASRLAERFGKPVILMQIEGDLAKGSARSVGDFSIINALHQAKHLLVKYGGHDFAAGLTIKVSDINQLRQILNKYAENMKFKYFPQLEIDLKIPTTNVNLESYDDMERLSPFGRDNAQPILSTVLELKNYRPVGKDFSHLRLTFKGEKTDLVGIVFSHNDKWPWLAEAVGQKIQAAYRLNKNQWNGRVSCQLEVVDLRRQQ